MVRLPVLRPNDGSQARGLPRRLDSLAGASFLLRVPDSLGTLLLRHRPVAGGGKHLLSEFFGYLGLLFEI